MNVECFSGCVLEKLVLPKLEYLEHYYAIEKINLAKIVEFIIPKVIVSYKIFVEFN